MTHIVDWREEKVAKVQWCNRQFLTKTLVIKAGEEKLCTACGRILLNMNRKIVEQGFVAIYRRCLTAEEDDL